MDDLLRFLNKRNFPLGSPLLNGKIQRFKRDGDNDKDCWFIGWEHFGTNSGKPYIIAFVGDWGSDELHEFRSEFDYSKEDLRKIKKAHQDIARQREAEIAQAQEATAVKAEKLWYESASEGLNDYCKRKGIDANYGTRLDKQRNELLVPVRDITGKLWSVQRIIGSGDKFFLPGTKKKGCFFQIPEGVLTDDETIYVCEGFATAVSVHLATGRTVLAAFDAGNLEPVAVALRGKLPNAFITICADNDQFGEKNVGVIKATEAAKKSGATVVVPHFTNLKDKPTDFNDLHLSIGLEAVKKQIVESDQGAIYLRCMGHSQGDFYYTSSSNQELVALSRAAHTQNSFLSIMPLHYWESRFPGLRGPDWQLATSVLMEQCLRKGIFSVDKVRGAGAWVDEKRLVINLGDRIHCSGREFTLSSFPTSQVYTLTKHMPSLPETASQEDTEAILAAASVPLWTDKSSAALVAGWAVIARLCGALPWRPMMWLTSEFGKGKSTFIQEFIKKLIGAYGIYPLGGSTEAGIRQRVLADAKPIIFDEAETNDRHSGLRIQSLLALARLSSSENEGEVLKGTADGQGMTFACRSSFFLASIRVNLQEQADKSRFTVVEIGDGFRVSEKEALSIYSKVTPEMAERVFARSVKLFPVTMKNNTTFRYALSDMGYTPREGQQLGILLAGYHSLLSVGEISEVDAARIIGELGLSRKSGVKVESEIVADHEACLSRLMEHVFEIETFDGKRLKISVGRAVEQCRVSGDYQAQLQMLGLDVKDGQLLVATQHSALEPVFRGTKWENNWAPALLRTPSAQKPRHRFGDWERCNPKMAVALSL